MTMASGRRAMAYGGASSDEILKNGAHAGDYQQVVTTRWEQQVIHEDVQELMMGLTQRALM